MRRRLLVGVVLVVALAAASGALAATPVFQVNHEAGFRVDAIPTSDPCVVGFASGYVVDFIDPDDVPADFAIVQFGYADICGPFGWTPLYAYDWIGDIPESAFTVSPNQDSAHLTLSVDAFEVASQTAEPITVDLYWDSPPGIANDETAVTGFFTSPRTSLQLDESIPWNPWSILLDPDLQPPLTVAGLWRCQFNTVARPACIGQTR